MQGRGGNPPDPTIYSDWRAFASALRTYLSEGEGVRETIAQAVQLRFVDLTDTANPPRVGPGGVLAFDVNQGLIVSQTDGTWHKVTTAVIP